MSIQSAFTRVETVKPKVLTQFTLYLNCPTPTHRPLCKSPHGQQMAGPLVWDKDELSEDRYIYLLSEEHIQECNNAMRGCLESNEHPGYISQETFPLPTLAPILRQLTRELHNVNGLLLIRGLNPQVYTPKEFMVLTAGIGSWIGNKRGVQAGNTSQERSVALHIFDHDIEKIRGKEPNRFVPSSNTNGKMDFHTDFGDIISLAYCQVSTTGGELHIASSWSVYNDMVQNFPEMIETLKKPYPWHIVGNVPDRFNHGLLHETFNPTDGTKQLSLMCEKRPFFGDPYCEREVSESLPELTMAQVRALEMIGEVAHKHKITIKPMAGDVLYLHNRVVLHGRSSYIDTSPEVGQKRHVIRSILRDAEYSWPIPEVLKPRFDSMFGRTDNPEHEDWPLIPEVWKTDPQHG